MADLTPLRQPVEFDDVRELELMLAVDAIFEPDRFNHLAAAHHARWAVDHREPAFVLCGRTVMPHEHWRADHRRPLCPECEVVAWVVTWGLV